MLSAPAQIRVQELPGAARRIHKTVPLRDIDRSARAEGAAAQRREAPNFASARRQAVPENATFHGGDPLAGAMHMPRQLKVHLTADGYGTGDVNPPDPVGAVGKNHYIMAANGSNGQSFYQIFDKQGNVVLPATGFNTLFVPPNFQPGGYDPIVLYDQEAERWLIASMSTNFIANSTYWAISETSDPMGSWYLYEISASVFPDYPKITTWSDAYFTTVFTGGAQYHGFAVERDSLLAGAAAPRVQEFSVPNFGGTQAYNFWTSIDWDGAMAPPAGSPIPVIRLYDDGWNGGQDKIEMFEISIDWDTPSNTVLNGPIDIFPSAFDVVACGAWNACIPYANSTAHFMPLESCIMFAPKYRNFGTHESMVLNHLVDISVSASYKHIGIRWYELRRNGSSPWTIYQEGTLAPDTNSRFMGSIAMDGRGSIAMGYTHTGYHQVPGLRVTGRLQGDTLGKMTFAEHEFRQNQQTYVGGRWGDYFSMTVDPEDDTTFWFIGEYVDSGSGSNWATGIISFSLPTDSAPFVGISPLQAADIQLYPNPSTGRFSLNWGQHQPLEAIVRNLHGQEVRRFDLRDHQENNLQADLRDMARGLYFVELRLTAGTLTKKVLLR